MRACCRYLSICKSYTAVRCLQLAIIDAILFHFLIHPLPPHITHLQPQPTSGLDSFQAYHVMRSLKRLCCTGTNDENGALAGSGDGGGGGGGGGGGHTVVVSIHQPRSTVWQMFDGAFVGFEGRVMVKVYSEGYCSVYVQASSAVGTMRSLTYTHPYTHVQ